MAPTIAVGVSILVLFFRYFWPPHATAFVARRKEMPDLAGELRKDGRHSIPRPTLPFFSAGGSGFMVRV